MSGFDMNEFLALLRQVDPSHEANLSTLQLDRFIQAYIGGAHTPAELEAAVQHPGTSVTLYAHLFFDDLEEIAGQLGLKDAALRRFVSAADRPLKLNCSVESDGTPIVEMLEDTCTVSWALAL